MPIRSWTREARWLLPPSLDELVPADHPARFVAAFVDSLERTAWLELGVDPSGEPTGAPAYDPRVLLSVWLYGFMTGVRSCRKLETACRDQLPYLWLTGCQRPDHNTLWRFYQAHRQNLRELFSRTVRTAVKLGLVDLAVRAVDGTKIAGNAARERTYDAAGLQRLEAQTAAAIADLEDQNSSGGDSDPPRLPPELAAAQELRQRLRTALEQVASEEGPDRLNLTDPDARLVKTRQGFVAGYNAQAVVSPLEPAVSGSSGLLITAAEVDNQQDDHGHLLPMVSQAEAATGQSNTISLADGGYHSGANLVVCTQQGRVVAMAEGHRRATDQPNPRDSFVYEADSDSYRCPQGKTLVFCRTRQRAEHRTRIYRAAGRDCRTCPAFGTCTTNAHGRLLEIGPYDAALREHRRWMATEQAKALYRRRSQIVEPAFGILKDQQSARRFLLRGLDNVRAEWSLLATAFNLRVLARLWQHHTNPPKPPLVAAAFA